MRGELVIIDIEDFIKVCNDDSYKIIPLNDEDL
jgi:hypothetical protein